MEDQRFAHIAKDPKFRRIPKGQTKIKIDKRFQSMFKDKKFQVKYTTDKRGRPVSHSSREDLKRYYHISSEESDSESDNASEASSAEGSSQEIGDSESNEVGKFVRPPKTESEPNELEVTVQSDKKLSDSVKKKLKNLTVDYARGESTLLSESSSDDDDTEEEGSESEDVDHKWGELDADAEKTEETTHRLAACNMDWDRIRALDLMVLFNSFLPPGGVIKSVVIYPSEFGKQRMQEEELKGPIELTSNLKNKKEPITDKATDDTGDQNNEEGSKYHMEKLRQYQLNRLKYYYAVITFDSPNSANKIYTECDGMEYESSATKIDLRFIPNETSFDGDEIKEKCDKLPELNKYKPRFFTTTALQQAKVDLTWDETDPDRLELAEKINSGKLDEISEKDLQNYLAGSSSEEEENGTIDAKEIQDKDNSDISENEEESVTDKYKLLLQEIQKNEDTKKNKDVEMEITWGINLKEKTDQIMQKKTESQEKAPFQKYLDKRKEKRKEKRQKKKNSESEEDIPTDIDMNDPYFAEEFEGSEFKAIKKKKGKVSKQDNDYDNTDNEASGTKHTELELLLEDEDDGKKHFSLKKIQEQESKDSNKKKKHKKKYENSNKNKIEDEFKVNVEDERFSALFTSHHYNIDPTDSHYKKTRGMETLISEKLKRRDRNSDDFIKQNVKKVKLGEDKNITSNKKKSSSSELSLLVKSVKRKADGFKSK